MRINRYLAQKGYGSRRGVEKWIIEGKVSVNGKVVTDLSKQILDSDQVHVEGLNAPSQTEEPEIWIYHKPMGELCTRKDPSGRPTIFQHLKHLPPPYQSVGRLDFQSRGLLLISRNGHLTRILSHPSSEISRIYSVRVQGFWKQEFEEQLKNGVQMEEGGLGHMLVQKVHVVKPNLTELKLLLYTGKKREIRYSMSALGLNVIDLFRIQYHHFSLKGLKEKESRALTSNELQELKKEFNSDAL